MLCGGQSGDLLLWDLLSNTVTQRIPAHSGTAHLVIVQICARWPNERRVDAGAVTAIWMNDLCTTVITGGDDRQTIFWRLHT